MIKRIYAIYFRDREFARVMGDPLLWRVRADDKNQAETLASSAGYGKCGGGCWAVEDEGYLEGKEDVTMDSIPQGHGLLWVGYNENEGARAWDISIYADSLAAELAFNYYKDHGHRGVLLYEKSLWLVIKDLC